MINDFVAGCSGLRLSWRSIYWSKAQHWPVGVGCLEFNFQQEH